jgi:hypothetical protein
VDPELIEQPSSGVHDSHVVRPSRHRERVGRERVEDRPRSNVVGIKRNGRVYPAQRFPQRLGAALFGHRPAREILNEAMHAKARRAAIAIDARR